jgi:hypothetical protein
MKPYLIYLAGPISGLNYDGATSWRVHVRREIEYQSGNAIACASPMRHKEYLTGEVAIGDSYEDTVLSSQRGIFHRDKFDATRCDLLFVNLLGATKVSIGTVMEIAWANGRDIPIVLAMEKEGNPHEHAMLREACAFRCPTVEEAMHVAMKVLLP